MRLWEDGFDHYGTSTGFMLDGSYASISNNAPSTAQAATGTHSMRFGGDTFTGGAPATLRKVLPTSVTGLGKCFRIYMPALPTTLDEAPCVMGIPTADAGIMQISVVVDTNGALRLYRGMRISTSQTLGTLLYQSDPLLVASAWQHVELQVGFSNTTGYIRCAVEGVDKFEVTGLDTLNTADPILSDATFLWGDTAGSNSSGFYFDDYFLYDFTGNPAVDTDFCPTLDGTGMPTNYIGNLEVWPLFPNGDTSEADWLKSTGTVGNTLINEHTPDDAGYIYSLNAGDLSEFDLDDLPVEITYIRGLGLHGRMSKSDAGAAFIKQGMKSVAATDDADERPITVEPTYWRDTMDVDPNSGARWTRTSLNAAKYRLTRTV